MTVGELILLLEEFPPEPPVFFCPDAAGRIALAPRDAILNLVRSARREVMADDDLSPTIPEVCRRVLFPALTRPGSPGYNQHHD